MRAGTPPFGSAIADLLPEAFELVGEGAPVKVGIAAVTGFIGFSLLEAFFHQSSFEHAGAPGHDHSEDDDHPRATMSGPRAARGGARLIGLLPPLSLVAHSAMDGLMIGFAFQAGDEIGLVVLLAVLAHDFADGMNVATVALDAARGTGLAIGFVLLDGIAAPIGGFISTLVTIDAPTLGVLLGLFAGVFLAVGAGHLLPESQHHDPRRGPLMVGLAACGAAFALAVRAIAPS